MTFSVFDHDLFRDSLEELGVALVDGTSQAFLYALMQPTSPVDMGFEIVSTRALISAHERLEAMHQAQQALATNAGSVLGR